jgi:hypothetical protein
MIKSGLLLTTLDCEFSDGETMERLRKCLSDPARNCDKMILLTNDSEKAKTMLKRNYGSAEKIVEKLLGGAKAQKPVKNTNDFQEFSNLVENLSMKI